MGDIARKIIYIMAELSSRIVLIEPAANGEAFQSLSGS
jgi:hypothetical protein